MRDLANLFKALGDQTRLQILTLLLRHGELCVCDVEKVLGITQSKASRHLRYLLHSGLVEDRRVGVWSHYRIAEGLGGRARAVLEGLEAALPSKEVEALDGKLQSWLAVKAAAKASCGPEGEPREDQQAKASTAVGGTTA